MSGSFDRNPLWCFLRGFGSFHIILCFCFLGETKTASSSSHPPPLSPPDRSTPPNNGGFFSFSSLLFFPFLFDSSHLSLFLCANSFEREFREQTEHISVLPLVEASKIAKFRKHTQFCLIRELSPSTSDLGRLRLGPILSYIIQLNDI